MNRKEMGWYFEEVRVKKKENFSRDEMKFIFIIMINSFFRNSVFIFMPECRDIRQTLTVDLFQKNQKFFQILLNIRAKKYLNVFRKWEKLFTAFSQLEKQLRLHFSYFTKK